MARTLTIVGLGGSVARSSRSRAAPQVAADVVLRRGAECHDAAERIAAAAA